jgi:hypothetical protein
VIASRVLKAPAVLLAAVVFAVGCWGAVGGASAAQARPVYGIGDQSQGTFTDPRFAWLGVRNVRLVVPYDVVRWPSELARARAWLLAAQSARLDPLVVFSHSTQRPRLLPSVNDYRHAVAGFHSAFPWVGELVTWDEENHVSQPTARSPSQAARYYHVLRGVCPHCIVVAADVLDQPGIVSWLRAFRAYAPGARLWGLHNYYDLNHGGRRGTTEILRTVPGSIWFTETGGLVWRYDSGARHFIVRGEANATRAAQRLAALVAMSPRIQRVYYYHWRVDQSLSAARLHPGRVTWDSGLVRPDCSPRPALKVLAADMGRNPRRIPAAVLDRSGNCSAPRHAPAAGA